MSSANPNLALKHNNNALVLSGGGARAAYQVGVLSALRDILPPQSNPFSIICGTSAGAINALALAANSDDLFKGIKNLKDIWQELSIDNVFRTDCRDLAGGLGRILLSFFHQGIDRHKPLSLLDNSPLNAFLKQHINFSKVQQCIDQGSLKAVCVCALGYSSGDSVNFFQGHQDLLEWRRHRRVGVKAVIGMEHLMASSAIPMVFPTVRIGHEYFGDGAMRQLTPISPALHLGADKVFIVGVSSNRQPFVKRFQKPARHAPSVAQVAGHMFNSAFVDSLESDIERMERINQLLEATNECTNTSLLRPIKSLVISPSQAIDKIAGRNVRHMPKRLRYVLRTSGATAKAGGSALASYILFAKPFIDNLIELGYQDAMWERNAIEDFMAVDNC